MPKSQPRINKHFGQNTRIRHVRVKLYNKKVGVLSEILIDRCLKNHNRPAWFSMIAGLV